MRQKLQVFLFLFLWSAIVFAQNKKTVTGVVSDKSNQPLPAVSISLVGSTIGTTTNIDGKFSISVPENAKLSFSYIGFHTRTITIGNNTTINVTLEEDDKALGEVVVTALGIKREQKSLGYAAQPVKGDDITKAAPVDLAQGLMGKVAGLNISTGNGLSDASSRIVIRGNNSLFGNNQPLIVVDGAIMDNKPLDQSNTNSSDLSTQKDWGNYLSYLNMDNIENVSVLKGPNAAALYGARGANGVILITTKKGAPKKGMGIDYSYTTNFTDVYRFQDLQNQYGGGSVAGLVTANPQLPKNSAGEYFLPTLYGGSSYATGGSGIPYYHGVIPNTGGKNAYQIFSWFGAGASWGPKMEGQMVRWWDGQMRAYSPQPNNREFYYNTGSEKTHNVAFNTANDFGTLRLSASTSQSDAVIDNVNNKKTSFSLGSTVKISKMLSAELSASYNQAFRLNTADVGSNNSWSKFSTYGMSREYQPLEKNVFINPDGSKFSFPNTYPYAEYGVDLFWNKYDQNQRLWRDELVSTVKVNAEITPWLNAFARTSGNFIGNRFETTNNTTSADHLTGGVFSKEVNKSKVLNTDLMATLHKNDFLFKGFNASLSGMYNEYSNNLEGVYASNNTGSNTFKVPDLYTLSNYTDVTKTSFAEKRYDVQSNSLLGILNLSYKDYLFLDLTGRNDINSTLPKNNNSYFYPSASAAFIFSEAFDLGKVKDVLSYGKLRVAYGKSANAAEPYMLDATYTVGTFGGQATNSLPGTVPPTDLRFQTSKSIEVGTNLGFLNDRINLDFTYYDIISEHQIMTSALSSTSGSANITFNSGALRNRGIEFIVNANPYKTKDFTWNISLNGAKNDNFVESLPTGILNQTIASVFGNQGAFMKVAVGEKYGTIYGTDFKRDAQGNKLVKNEKDVSGNVIGTTYVVTTDPVAIGNAAPKLTGGMGNTFKYKQFSLYGLIDFKYGGDIYSFDHATAMGNGLAPETLVERNGGGLPYTFPDGTKANVGVILEGFNVDDNKINDRVVNPMYKYAGSYAAWSDLNRPRSLSVFENSWVKLREVALTYDLPQNLIGKTKFVQGLSLSLIGRNLCYLYTTLPDHLNPEAVMGTGNGQGLQWSSFPSMRTFGVSLKAKF
ncbi:SusC/RagA family TonB-linked outer membrane protein [Solitalea lacus]|uniref:SusC/RagA family TonB-linked outer membrane protein n=1 Tax=Solitalea lacus TaxID=2911172 RepID=UPI001EDA404B|nr:SusC/RagA family TonB-linked outer membrane protein [Solitalea lacus]UKJ07670.1 SusC/RagA family TonB-linked outer membrane protein [Solitalea lacus]